MTRWICLTVVCLLAASVSQAAGPADGDKKTVEELKTAEVRFAASLYAAAAAENSRDNLAIAPYSAFESLAMLQLGAAGETRKAIHGAAGISPTIAQRSQAFGHFRRLGEKPNFFFPGFLATNNGYGLKLLEAPFQGSAASQSGLGKGDLIFSVNSQPVRTENEMLELCRKSSGVIDISGFDFSEGAIITRRRVTLNKGPFQGPLSDKPLLTAAAIWLHQDIAERTTYPALLGKHYGAEVFVTQFRSANEITDQAARYFSQRTANRITHVQPVEVNSQTRFILMQASALDAQWRRLFSRELTQTGAFTTPQGIVDTPYMKKLRPVLFAQMQGYRVIELPLQGGNLSMRFFLPKEPGGWRAVEAQWLRASEQERLTNQLKRQWVDIRLPRFRAETNGSLKSPLSRMGLANLFSSRADFSGISNDQTLKLADVRQQTFVEIDEQGVRAGAVTQSIGILKSERPANPLTFHAKHPFLFQIVDASGPIFFAGRVTYPEPAR